MILAQNHLQPLSGNNMTFFRLVSFIVMLSFTQLSYAQLFKGKKDKADVTFSHEDKNTSEHDNFFEDSLYVPMHLEEQTFKITFILPLYLKSVLSEIDSLTSNKNEATQSNAISKAKLGLAFYHGLLFGLDSLSKNYPVTFEITLLDSENDEEKVKEITASPAFYTADLIIGPVFNNTMKIAAEKAKKYNIPIVFPLSPTEEITQENHYFFKVNPGIHNHLKYIHQWVAENFSNQNILLIQETADEASTQYFSSLPKENWNFSIINFLEDKFYMKDATQRKNSIESFLSKEKNNVIVVPSIKLEFAHKLSRHLQEFADSYKITLIGMPIWNPENDLRLDYLEKLNLHFTQSAYLPDSLFFNSHFAQSFFNVFKYYPSVHQIIGYDIAYYFGKLLFLEGKNFKNKVENYRMPCYHTEFNFKRSYSEGSFHEETKFLYFENTELHIFKIENLQLIKVN